MSDNIDFVLIEDIAEFMRGKGVSVDSAMASLSMTVVAMCLKEGIPKERLLSAMSVTYDVMEKNEREETCH